MNKILRYSFMALLAMMFGNVSAEDVTMEYTGTTTSNMKADGTNEAATLGLDATKWNVTASKGSASNAPGLNKDGDIRLYWNTSGSNTISVESLGGVNINTITITFTANTYSNVTVQAGGKTISGNDGTYTINSSSFVLGNGNTSNTQVRIKSVVINYSSSSDSRTATAIEFSEGYATRFTYGANGESVTLPTVTVTSEVATRGTAVDGATATWELTKGADFVVGDAEPTIDGNVVKPSNHSYGKLTLTASYAGNASYKSSTKSYTLTVYKGYLSLTEVIEDFKKEDSKFTSTGIPVSYWCADDTSTGDVIANTATVTYVNGSYTYINDGTNDLLLFGSNLGLKKGDVITNDKGNEQGNDAIYGTMKNYNGLLELATSADEMQFTIKSQGAEVTPKTIEPAALSDINNMNAYLKIENAEYVSAAERNLTFKVGEATFIVRQNWTNVSITDLETTAKYTLEGMGAVYNTTPQLYLISFTKTAEPAGITNVKANSKLTGARYNLAGQKVNAGYKGVVIQNGQKVVVK